MKILLILALSTAVSSQAATYYASPTGNDTNNGLSTGLPFKTVVKAMSRAVAGDTVLLRGGVYREQVEVLAVGSAGSPITLAAYPGEVPTIKGSDLVTGWVQESPLVWKKTGWTINSQQVFVDFDAKPGNSLQQIGMPSSLYTTAEYPSPVGSGLASMTAGSFYYSPSSSTLYIRLADGSDPNAHVIEVSVRRRLVFMHNPYIQVKGLFFRHSNASAFAQQEAAVTLSSNSSIENCDIQYADFAGLSMGYLTTNTTALNCNVSNNGNSGVNTSSSYNFRITNVSMKGNNTRKFNALWHAGGFKGTTKSYGVVENCEVAFNNGTGIWFDYANSGSTIVIRNNYIHDNGPVDAGIHFEVSKNGLIYNNVIIDNSRRGIYLSGADNTQVFHNTIVGSRVYAGIEVGGMPRSGATLTNNKVYNNIVSGGSGLYDLIIAPANGSTIVGNMSDYNDFFRGGGPLKLTMGTSYTTLTAWRAGTQMDLHSISADPRFVAATIPPSAANYALSALSPVIDVGTRGVVTPDYLAVTRPFGLAFDLGAFEATSAPAPDRVAPAAPVNLRKN